MFGYLVLMWSEYEIVVGEAEPEEIDCWALRAILMSYVLPQLSTPS